MKRGRRRRRRERGKRRRRGGRQRGKPRMSRSMDNDECKQNTYFKCVV